MSQSVVGLFVNIFLQIMLPLYYLSFLLSVVSDNLSYTFHSFCCFFLSFLVLLVVI